MMVDSAVPASKEKQPFDEIAETHALVGLAIDRLLEAPEGELGPSTARFYSEVLDALCRAYLAGAAETRPDDEESQ
jgi:hypothetical protein